LHGLERLDSMSSSKFRNRGKGESTTVSLDDEAGTADLIPDKGVLSDALDGARLPENSRINKWLDAAATQADKFNPNAGACMRATKPVTIAAIRVIMCVAPLYKALYMFLYKLYQKAPVNVIQMVFGGFLCFFGGHYFASLAAIEAFRQFGWTQLVEHLTIIGTQAKLIGRASLEDDTLDENNDGVADVDQISPQELAQRKIELAMKTVTEPARLQSAIGALWSAYISVLATLRLEFARTTALALSIVEMSRFTIMRIFAGPLMGLLGTDLKHWAETIISTIINFIAIIVAWYAQMIISSFYSALRGGKMFADGLFNFLVEKKLLQKLPCFKDGFNADESFLDEYIGYLLAAVGFTYQFVTAYQIAFPLNLVFLPLDAVELFLRYQIYVTGTPLQPASG